MSRHLRWAPKLNPFQFVDDDDLIDDLSLLSMNSDGTTYKATYCGYLVKYSMDNVVTICKDGIQQNFENNRTRRCLCLVKASRTFNVLRQASKIFVNRPPIEIIMKFLLF